MSIVSLNFAVFLLILIFLYFIIGKFWQKGQWVILLIGSYVFYLTSSPKFVFFLLFSTFVTWFFSKLISIESNNSEQLIASKENIDKIEKKQIRQQSENKKFKLIFACLLCNIGLLIFLKYTNFILVLFGTEPLSWLILPLGISFYTFQSVGYTIDVYRGTIEPEANLFKYALYVSFFPQICQGPIGRYSELAPQLYASHSFDYDRFVMGAERCLIGLFKKLAVANNVGIVVNSIYAEPGNYSSLLLTMATFMYGLQLYADFSGYMDIMLGIGQILGIKLEENFKTPYFSKTIAEFWRRWHISLGNWFKDYLYYSILRTNLLSDLSKKFSKLGKKKLSIILPTVIGLIITWFLIGLWHGASWNFVFYGMYHGLFIILSVFLSNKYELLKTKLIVNETSWVWKGFQTLRTYLIVNMGYILFRATDLPTAYLILKKIFTGKIAFSVSSIKNELLAAGTNISFWLSLFASLIILLLIELLEEFKEPLIIYIHRAPVLIRWGFIYIMLLFVLSFIGNAADAESNFLYFKF